MVTFAVAPHGGADTQTSERPTPPGALHNKSRTGNTARNMQEGKERKIVLVPNGGLANRMRAVNSMAEFTRAEKIGLHVIWISNSELNAPFSSLFKPLPHTHATLEEKGIAASLLYNSPRKGNLYLSALATRLLFTRRLFWRDVKEAKEAGRLETLLRQPGTTFIESNYDFGDYSGRLAANFRPSGEVEESVRRFTSLHFAPRTIGIHIRRTDNTHSIAGSPTGFFIDAIRKELADAPDTKFYVASDDAAEKEKLGKIFGQKIITRNIECRRNREEGIIHAAEDLFILSRTARIYGSYYSSFSEMASALGGAELILPR